MRANFRLSTPPIFFVMTCPFSALFGCPPGLFNAFARARDFAIAKRVFILLIEARENIGYFSFVFFSDFDS